MSGKHRKGNEAEAAGGSERATVGSEAPTALEREEWISRAAYFLFERRREAGEPPDALRDWLDAERVIGKQQGKRPVGHVHGS
jgi:hypothetical protein